MKLPFNIILTPLLKPHLAATKLFCQHPIFSISILYTYLFSTLGLIRATHQGERRKLYYIYYIKCINIHHLKRHIGEVPCSEIMEKSKIQHQEAMLVHDLKIIATSMGVIQYACLLVGCLTENPSLFLPHLIGQTVILWVKIINAFLVLHNIDMKSLGKFRRKLTGIAVMTFNWLQEFCVFRQYLCVCDL